MRAAYRWPSFLSESQKEVCPAKLFLFICEFMYRVPPMTSATITTKYFEAWKDDDFFRGAMFVWFCVGATVRVPGLHKARRVYRAGSADGTQNCGVLI